MRPVSSALLVAVFLSFIGVTALAADSLPDQASFNALEQEVGQLFQQKKYDEAAEKCKAQIGIAPKHPNPHYNLACALARQAKTDDALNELTKSVELGFTDVGHIKSDEDLATLRENKRFTELLDKVREKEKSSFERGADIKGVKTIDALADGGFNYRVRMSPTATEEKPNKLVIWLHPSGGSMNAQAEALSPFLIERGFALLVVTRKQWMGWGGDEPDKLLNKTLPDVAKIKGIDARKPILMGYSAGGQMALQVWNMDGGKFGGLILDAAYPIDMEKYMRGQSVPQALPKNEGIKAVPMFVLVGDKDGGAGLWRQVMKDWLAAGVPITYREVPNQGHTWLFGQQQLKDLSAWLEQVAAGKLPSDAPVKKEIKDDKAPEKEKPAATPKPKLPVDE